ncbi:MAG TPA: hypothetical protein VMY35_14460 [Phycisphaerae bacterium]|nr:hypothetical protein [Phycisphaerae bacterium]
MNEKCESCGSAVVTAPEPSGFVEHHREGGLDCVRTQLAKVREEAKRLREAIREALRHDLAPGGWGGPAAENILIKALAVKDPPSPEAMAAKGGEG